VFPQLSIAKALRARGHEVAFATPEQARTYVEAEGFPIMPFVHVDENQWRRVHKAEQETSARRQTIRIQRDAFRWLVDTMPDQIRDIQASIDTWRPDAIICDIAMWAPIMVLWQSVPIPVVLSSTFMGPLIPGPEAPPWGFGFPAPRTASQRWLATALTRTTELLGTGMRRSVDEIRRAHGLPRLDCSLNRFTARLPLYLVGNVRELDYGRNDLPPNVHYVGACTWHPPESPGTTAWLSGLPVDKPWVHVTEGTSHYQDHFVLRAAAGGLAGASVEAILTTGRSLEPEQIGLTGLAPNIHVSQWLSHSELLPRCKVVVTTGGPATIIASLRAGVPLVVVPTSWDKPDNARRVVEAGVGVRLKPRHCTEQGLRNAVETVLGDSSFAARAHQMSVQLEGAGGPEQAATLLESLVPSKIDADRGRSG
jgi:MGT family glycosyltransferase